MGNFINGYSSPIIQIKLLDNTLVKTFNLPYCNLTGGMATGYRKNFKRHILQDYSLVDFGFKGTSAIFTLDYSTLLKKPTYLDINEIDDFHSQPEIYKIILIPRGEVKVNQYEVRYADENILELGIHRNADKAIGNTKSILRFQTQTPFTSNMFVDPDNLNRPLPFELSGEYIPA